MIITFSNDFVPLQTPELDVCAAVDAISIANYCMTWKHDSPIGNVVCAVTWAKGRRVRFTLETRDAWACGSRTSANGRHMRKASWEAHRDVMLALFDLDPHATVRTALAVYRGREDFDRKFEATGETRCGGFDKPVAIRDTTVRSWTYRIGTSHFVDFAAAYRYYRDVHLSRENVQHKIDAGEIHLGKPATKPGERLVLIDRATRYAIEVEGEQ